MKRYEKRQKDNDNKTRREGENGVEEGGRRKVIKIGVEDKEK